MDEEKKPDKENLRTAYKEVCQNHRAITEFRGKLLTLLPLASGVGIYLLIPKGNPSKVECVHLVAIGIFGVLVTVGLFLHELRGIKHCGALIELGSTLEKKLDLLEGQFMLEYAYYNPTASPKLIPKGLWRVFHQIVGPVGAAWIIYPSVVVAWGYVAALGLNPLC